MSLVARLFPPFVPIGRLLVKARWVGDREMFRAGALAHAAGAGHRPAFNRGHTRPTLHIRRTVESAGRARRSDGKR